MCRMCVLVQQYEEVSSPPRSPFSLSFLALFSLLYLLPSLLPSPLPSSPPFSSPLPSSQGVGPTAQRAAVIAGVLLPSYDFFKKLILDSGLLRDNIATHFL